MMYRPVVLYIPVPGKFDTVLRASVVEIDDPVLCTVHFCHLFYKMSVY